MKLTLFGWGEGRGEGRGGGGENGHLRAFAEYLKNGSANFLKNGSANFHQTCHILCNYLEYLLKRNIEDMLFLVAMITNNEGMIG